MKFIMPPLPHDLRTSFAKLKLDKSAVDTLVVEMPAGKLVHDLLETDCSARLVKRVANWLVSDVQAVLSDGEKNWEDLKLNPEYLVDLAKLVEGNKISSTGAKTVLLEMIKTGEVPLKIAEAKNVLQTSDKGEIDKIVHDVLKDNPQAARDVKSGELKAIGFLVGQVMKASKGKANPALAQELIKKQLG
jgi:aspartyl-tRNA(Asn)/glutamyl-tRNA(Gln) amidotransferase subunit B